MQTITAKELGTDEDTGSIGTQRWIDSLGLDVETPWRPWTVGTSSKVAGYVTKFAKNFTFATVRDAGHMVPRYKGKEALAMITRWLQMKEI